MCFLFYNVVHCLLQLHTYDFNRQNLAAKRETPVQLLGQEDPLKKRVYTMGFSGGLDSKESTCNVGDLGLIPRLGRSPWRRAWQPTPVFLPAESPWTEEPGRLQSMGSQNRTRMSNQAQHAAYILYTYLIRKRERKILYFPKFQE